MEDYESIYTGPEIDAGVGFGRAAGTTNGLLKGNGNGIETADPGEDYSAPLIIGNGAPNGSVSAIVGQFYLNTAAASGGTSLYICKAKAGAVTSWEGIPGSYTKQELNALIGAKYTKPETGIPVSDLDADVQESLEKADEAYMLPETGIPASDLDAGVQASLAKAADKKDLQMLYDLSDGFVFNHITDVDPAYIKTVREGTVATIDYIGGKTVEQSGVAVSAMVSSIVSKDSEEETLGTFTIPEGIKTLEGYGWSVGDIYNEVDFKRQVFIKRVSRIDCASFNRSGQKGIPEVSCFGMLVSDSARHTDEYSPANLFCPGYPSVPFCNETDVRGVFVESSNPPTFWFRGTGYSDLYEFKSAMSGIYVYYELKEPIEIDISQYLIGAPMNLQVADGGSLTFVQENSTTFQVPNSVSFLRKNSTEDFATKEELNEKVNLPSDSGTPGQVLATDGSGGTYWKTAGGGGGGSSDYYDLDHKPKINGITLIGDLSTEDIGIEIPTNVSAFTNDAGYLTDQSLSPYRTAAEQDEIDEAKYEKPSSGIPKTDLASAVQTSLGKADTAVQPATLNDYATTVYVDSIVGNVEAALAALR